MRPRVVAVEIPTYADALSILRRTGTRMAGFRVTTGGWDMDQLASAFREARGGLAYLMPDFHNPTGALMPLDTRRAIVELAAYHRVTVVADETMRELDLREEPTPIPRVRGAVLIGSTSKMVWGGLRVGWLRGPVALIDEFRSNPLSGPLSASPIQQLLSVELLRRSLPIISERRAALRSQRDHLAKLLADDERWEFKVPPGRLALWLRLTESRAEDVVSRARACGIEISSGSRFAADATLSQYLRIPFTPPTSVLHQVAETLRNLA